MKSLEYGIWSSYDYELSPEDAVLAIEARGLTASELSDEHGERLLKRGGDPAAVGAAFRAFAEAHHVSFPQGHLWLKVHLCDPASDVVGILERWLILYAAVGVKNAVLHCDGAPASAGTDPEEIVRENVKVLRRLVPTAERLGIRICLENLRSVFDSAEILLSVIEAVGSPALGICLDTGHLNLTHPGTQEQFILTAGEKLHALHIADNQGKTDQHLMPFGCGTVDFASVMRGLSAVGYADFFNYEIPGERACPIGVRNAKAEYLKSVTAILFAYL